jgi:hypothetical protein
MNLKDFKATGLALLVILVALASTKGGLAALMPLLRFALPFIALVIAYKFIKGKLLAAAQDMQKRAQPRPDVIDLCPKCGKYMTGNHRC